MGSARQQRTEVYYSGHVQGVGFRYSFAWFRHFSEPSKTPKRNARHAFLDTGF